ncbi:MAG: 4-(cytidine 5'-diphospho)-2-C-methyl-D-erythritol kinase [Flavobacteriales bacterium]|nr:4-(cytidine 5'-diphospho)-2-C-methyl-D-erythritol kinase [Flavobacteriales bacterium]MCB9167664.1 4-(cytidine 5'-diphospho)-2-C-methyl-D-erythritol kinase [Flavobacteriales bacterium]
MVRFPHAKINLGLNVVRRRNDGYHDIRSVLLPIPLYDILEAVVDTDLPDGTVSLVRTGRDVPGRPDEDLIVRAAGSIHEDLHLPGIRAHLHKMIPVGGGLGGGSSDGTGMLLLLDAMLGLELSKEALRGYAARLGSDTSFFLEHRPCLALSRGEVLEPVDLDLSGHWFLLIDPGIHVSTAEAFGNVHPSGTEVDLIGILRRPIQEWRDRLTNDLEVPVFAAYPELASMRDALYLAGASYAAMSGSGSSMFGLFRREPQPLKDLPASRQWVLPAAPVI